MPGQRAPRFICEQSLTPWQSRQVLSLYQQFCEARRVSVLPQLVRSHRLSDGTVVHLSSQGEDFTVRVEPVGSVDAAEQPFIAYAVDVDPAFMPLFDREVIDYGAPGSGPKLPDEPGFDYGVPEPDYETMYGARLSRSRSSGGTSFTDQLTFSWLGITIKGELSAVDLTPELPTPDYRYTLNNYLWAPVSPVASFSEYQEDLRPIIITDAARPGYRLPFRGSDGSAVNIDVFGPPGEGASAQGAMPTTSTYAEKWYSDYGQLGSAMYENPDFLADIARMEALYLELKAAWENPNPPLTPWEQWQQARAEAYDAWRRTTWQLWYDECQRIIASWQTGVPVENHGLTAQRKQARLVQVDAVHRWLDRGVGDAHLAARFLRLPVLVDQEPTRVLADAGIVSRSEVLQEDYHGFPALALRYQASSATPGVLVQGSPNEGQPPHGVQARAVGDDWRSAACLFGSRMTGGWSRLQRHMNYHGGELAGVYLESGSLQFQVHSGYQAVIDSPLKSAPAGARVRTDNFLPAGASLTLVHFEYEVYDRFSDAWLWLSVPGMAALDPLWVQSLGVFIGPALKPAQAPRAVRVRGVTRQVRERNAAWSMGQQRPLAKDVGQFALPPGSGAMAWPCAVAFVSGYSRKMQPVEANVPGEPYIAYCSAWRDTMARVRAQLPPGSTEVEQVEQLVTLALRATGKDKPRGGQ